jgi:hypothetical protein
MSQSQKSNVKAGRAAAILLYLLMTVWVMYGIVIYFRLQPPADLKKYGLIGIDTSSSHLTRSVKHMWIYTIMMINCTLSFFHMIVFLCLTISISIYFGYKSCGLSILAERMTFKPSIVWHYIDMGIFSMLDPASQEELDDMYREADRRT